MDLILLSNEGDTDISTEVTLTNVENNYVYIVDLWKNRCVKADKELRIALAPCENILIYVSSEEIEAEDQTKEIHLGDWTSNFELKEKTNNTAIYEYAYEADSVDGGEYFTVTGEEMIECYCNDEFAGVSFWNTHRFDVGNKLQKGTNKIRLVVTGNAANIYVNANIAYGIGEMV